MIFVDKTANSTCTAVVRQIKKMLNVERVGHLGTLDPFATGLLPIMVGSTTRLSTELMNLNKEYLFTIQLGIETDTLDPTGAITKTKEVPDLSHEKILHVLKDFTGIIEQIPPVYSAIKMNGRPLYEYMRTTGKIPQDIDTKNRTIHIESCSLENLNFSEKRITIRVLCSKGTYVRSLARDIAYSLNTVGTCSELRRTKIGGWCVQSALSLSNNMLSVAKLLNDMVSPEKLLPQISKVILPECFFAKLNTGNIVSINQTEHLETFHAISKIIETNENCFIGIQKNDEILFLGSCTKMNDHRIICKPRKKII